MVDGKFHNPRQVWPIVPVIRWGGGGPSASKPLIIYAGLTEIISADFTLVAGITPSICTIYTHPLVKIPREGTLEIFDGKTVAAFHGCIVDKVEEIARSDSIQLRVTILDRRWRWRSFGQISGKYNIYGSKRPEINGATADRKTNRELVAMCLDAMGESGYDISAIDQELHAMGVGAGVFDFGAMVEWDYANPAEQLAELCDLLGCKPTLSVKGMVVIRANGVGRGLNHKQIIEGGISFDPPESPSQIIVVGGRSRWQYDFQLEAVALERDGDVVLLDDASYKPAVDNPWNDPDNFGSVAAKFREVAKQSVFRWYRIKPPFSLPMQARGGTHHQPIDAIEAKVKAGELWRILPVLTEQIERDWMGPKPAWVYGLFSKLDKELGHPEPFEDVIINNLFAVPRLRYTKPFTIDADRGIVKFTDPVYINELQPDGATFHKLPAELRLRTSCHLRHPETGAFVRDEYELDQRRRRMGAAVLYVISDELIRKRYIDYNPETRFVDNLRELIRKARLIYQTEKLNYLTESSGSFTLPGLQRWDIDGTVAQVSWIIDGDGHGMTRISINKEELIVTLNYDERRTFERIATARRGEKMTKVQRMEMEHRAPGGGGVF